MQSLPATSKASFNRLSAPLNDVFQSPSNCWRAGPSHTVPASAELTALMTLSIATFCCFIDRPRPFSCSGFAPYMDISFFLLGSTLLTTERHSEEPGAERSPAELGAQQREQQRDAVGKELMRRAQVVEFGERHPANLGDLAVVERERSVVDDPVAATDLGDVLVDESAVAEWLQVRVDSSQLLGQLAACCIVVRLAAEHHATDRDVPPTRPDVLGGAASVDQQPIVARHHGDADGPVEKSPGAHLATRDGGDDVVVVVDDVDKFVRHPPRSTIRPWNSTPCATGPTTCCRTWSPCVARCTSGPRSATTCPSRATPCWRPSTAFRSTSRCTRPPAASRHCSTA